jgi:endonuclease YncB( thermonuclease family)
MEKWSRQVNEQETPQPLHRPSPLNRRGDSPEVEIQHELCQVRLYGIDAPEHSQPHGAEPAEALARMLGQQILWLEEQHLDH